MEFQSIIESRRSIRSYCKDKKVTAKQVKEIVEAAILAPSWKNTETGRYYCVLDDGKREEFLRSCLPSFNAKNAANAALIVTTFVAGCSGFNTETGEPTNECGDGWGYYDLGLQNENLLLKAKELGLDTLIMGIRDADAIRAMLSIPKDEIIVSVIALGYADKEVTKPKRRAVDDIINIY